MGGGGHPTAFRPLIELEFLEKERVAHVQTKPMVSVLKLYVKLLSSEV